MVRVKPLKIAFVHPDLGIGGAERLIIDVAVSLDEVGVEVEFITNHFDKSHAFIELKGDKYPVHVVGDFLPRSFFGKFQALCAYIRMLFLALYHCLFQIFTSTYDIYFVDQIPMAVPILKWAGKKVIYYCHHPDLLASPEGGFLKRLYRKPIDWIEMYGTSKSDVILVNSEYTASVFRKTFPEITQSIQVVYPTIAATFRQDIAKAQKLPIHKLAPEIQEGKSNDIVFLSINRYHPAKKLELAINAMEELRNLLSTDAWGRVHLIMAGGYDPQSKINEEYFRKLVELTHSNGLVLKIGFLKSPSDKLKADLLKSCDCLLYTPVNEHFGIVPLEAMTAAKPVIACNSGGPRETVEHDVTGFLCEPNAKSLANYMAKFTDSSLSYKLGQNGLQRLERLFSYEIFVQNCSSIITQTFEQ